MGIKGLSKFLKKNCRNSFEKINLSLFKDFRIVIDTPIFVHKYLCQLISQNSANITIENIELNYKEIQKMLLILFIYLIRKFIINNIIPIFIFDGKCSELKTITHIERETRRKNQIKDIETLKLDLECELTILSSDKDELLNKYKKKISYYLDPQFKRQQIEIIKSLFKSLGILYIVADYEAEKLCATLCKQQKAIACYTTDTDIFAHGCPCVITNITNQIGTIVILRNILDELKLTYEQFKDFCIICGTDYNKNIKKCGPITCYKLIRTYKNFNLSYINGIKLSEYNEFKKYIIIYNEFTDSTQKSKLYYIYNGKSRKFYDLELLQKTFDIKIPININNFLAKLEQVRKKYCVNIQIFS